MIISIKKAMRFIALSVLCIGLSGCIGGDESLQQPKKGLFVLNVLDKALYNDCHIKGSVHLSLDDIDEFARTTDKSSEVIVYCSNYRCSTSAYVCEQLVNHGFENVRAYEGGTAEWYQMGFPVEGPSKSKYLTKRVKPIADYDCGVATIDARTLAQKLRIKV